MLEDAFHKESLLWSGYEQYGVVSAFYGICYRIIPLNTGVVLLNRLPGSNEQLGNRWDNSL